MGKDELMEIIKQQSATIAILVKLLDRNKNLPTPTMISEEAIRVMGYERKK